MFSFPQPTAADRAAIHELIPALPRPPIEDRDRPWSGLSGPFPGERIQLLMPDFGIVRVAQTWQAGSITMHEPGGTIFIVSKREGTWRIDGIMKQ